MAQLEDRLSTENPLVEPANALLEQWKNLAARLAQATL